ncbi:MAG: transporter substrate-binding domain-containing protein [Desulfobacterales bacterium]|nr:transporter substrate-binding domain-containing protein [Desulfobacterales bacterium]
MLIVSTDVPPFSGRDLPAHGATIEIIHAAFLHAGYTPRFEFYPWQRSVEMAKKGLAHGIGNLWYTPERAKWLVYSNSLYTPNVVGFFKSNKVKIKFHKYKDLARYTIGYIHGFAYPDRFFEQTKTFTRILYYDPKELIRALTLNRIDLALTLKQNGEYILENHFPDKSSLYDFMEPPIDKREEFLGISKKTDDYKTLLMEFNRGLSAILHDGTIKEILFRHNVDMPSGIPGNF